jgi:hypothetical protein
VPQGATLDAFTYGVLFDPESPGGLLNGHPVLGRVPVLSPGPMVRYSETMRKPLEAILAALGVGLRRNVVGKIFAIGPAKLGGQRSDSSHQPSASLASAFRGADSVTRLPRARTAGIGRDGSLGGVVLLLGWVFGLLLPHQSRNPTFLQREVNALHQVLYLIEGRIP